MCKERMFINMCFMLYFMYIAMYVWVGVIVDVGVV